MNVSRAVQTILFAALLVAVALFAVQAFPGLVGADYALTVQSGSMAPAISTGSVVFVSSTPMDQVEAGDVITYQDDGSNLITHRVVEVFAGSTSLRFETKGDANDVRDAEPVYAGDYVGTVTYSIPYIGYVTAFSQTPIGYVTLVLVPVLALIFTELWSLYRHMKPGNPNHE